MKHILTTMMVAVAATIVLSAQDYMELPAKVDGSGPYVTKMTTFGDDVFMRSFSYRYDTERKVALWVAYPLNSGLIGTGSRGDGWEPDTSLPLKAQPVLYKGFAYGSGYDRGHQIPSADRLFRDANQQTFVFTNATPQLHDFNGGIWAELEKLVRTWAKRSDTLYVVTGIIPGKSYISDNNGSPINIPDSYYKAVLRRNVDKKGVTRWSACSVVLPHKVFDVGTWQQNASLLRSYSVPLKNLEALTGEVYFPMLSDVVGKIEYEKLKNANPADESWWWK